MAYKWVIVNDKGKVRLDLGWFPDDSTKKMVRIYAESVIHTELSDDEDLKVIEV